MKKNIIIILFILISCASHDKKYRMKTNTEDANNVYAQAQHKYYKGDYKNALLLFKKYLSFSSNNTFSKDKTFWTIDQICRIYLRILKKPELAISFLNSISKNLNLNDAQYDNILEWIAVSKEWERLGKMPEKIKTPSELFYLGEKFYKRGMEKIQFPSDDAGNADFNIAATYLIPYIYNYDNGKHIGKALFYLGNIRFKSWTDYEYWSENFYLKEVIRRFPHSQLSWKAYNILEESIHVGYTGSGGDFTPPSQLKMLKSLKMVAKPKNK